jgi:hypothetical protein
MRGLRGWEIGTLDSPPGSCKPLTREGPLSVSRLHDTMPNLYFILRNGSQTRPVQDVNNAQVGLKAATLLQRRLLKYSRLRNVRNPNKGDAFCEHFYWPYLSA